MKVLHLFNEINYSGAEIMYASSAHLFQGYGIDMYAFSTGSQFGNFISEFEKNNIAIYHRPIKSGINISFKTLKFYLDFYRFLKKEEIKVLHIHRSDLYMVASVARIARVRTIKTMHNVFRHRKYTYVYGYLQRLIARKFLKVTFHTIGKSVYENELNYYHNPSVRINNWFNADQFYPVRTVNEKMAIREKLGIAKDTFVMISVGGCSSVKNHSDILRALDALPNKDVSYLYLHLGTGPMECEEKAFSQSLGLQEKVRFIGNKRNVREYLVASDVYLMPSRFEGLSISSLEAMASGLPSVLYNSVGLRDLINNDDNGFLIEPDYKTLASKILFFKENPGIGRKMADQAIKLSNSEYSMSQSVSRLVQLYQGTL